MSARGHGWGFAVAATMLVASAQRGVGQDSEPVWVYVSDGTWAAETISLGNRGTQVFAQHGSYSNRSPLFSSFDDSPANPVWQSEMQTQNFHRRVVSSEQSDFHAAMHQAYVSGSSGLRKAVLRVFRSSVEAPQWSFDFPVLIASHPHSGVAMSDDGARVVGAVFDYDTGTTHVATFGVESGQQLGYAQVSTFGPFLNMVISGDGSTLMLAGTSKLSVVSLPSGALLYSKYLSSEPNYGALDLSHDGRRFAYGTLGKASVYERSGGTYELVHTQLLPQGAHCNRLALDADGEALAMGLNFAEQPALARIQGVDLASNTLFLNHHVAGSGSLQNAVSSMSISSDGERIAAGLWGDSSGLSPELLAFRRGNPAPVLSARLPGSVLALSLSGDGRNIAVAHKDSHANELGGAGGYALYRVGSPDLQLEGVPHSGSTVTLALHARPGDYAKLLSSPLLAATPILFPNVGSLYLDRDTLSFSPGQIVGPEGTTDFMWPVPSSPESIGTTRYFQGLVLSPRELSESFVTLTVLP